MKKFFYLFIYLIGKNYMRWDGIHSFISLDHKCVQTIVSWLIILEEHIKPKLLKEWLNHKREELSLVFGYIFRRLGFIQWLNTIKSNLKLVQLFKGIGNFSKIEKLK